MKSIKQSAQEAENALQQIRFLWKVPFFHLLLCIGLVSGLTTNGLQAGNILVNPSFELNNGHTLPIGWTYFSPPPPVGYFGDYWVDSAVKPHSGTFYWKEWGALYLTTVSNVAGIYQNFSSVPGAVYQASGWFYTAANDILGQHCYVWIEVDFLGGTNLLALYKSDKFYSSVGTGKWFQYPVTNACDLSQPLSTGDPYFTTYATTGAVTQLVAPSGTTKVRYRFAYLQAADEGGSCYLDDAVLNQVSGPVPPVITDVSPLNMIFANPNDGLTFNVSSPAGLTINNSGIGLVLNGINVSTNLQITGSSSNKTVVYYGLVSNLTYTASITVTDSFNSTASANSYFETTWVGIPPIVYLWEAEDFDFNSGMYFNTPNLCTNSGSPNCYFGTVGVVDVDEHGGTGSSHLYRPDDAVGTSISGDYDRKNHILAGALDYRIDPFVGGEWLNYTRDWPAGTYWVIGRLSTDINLSGSVTLSVVNPDTSTTDLGTFTIANGRGWSAYDNVFLRDTNGNIVAVTLTGKETLRMTSGGNLLPNFLALVAGQIDQPQISNLYPTGTHPFETTNTLAFTVSCTGASIPNSGITITLDGADVSGKLAITGSDSSKNVVYPSLQQNALHTAIINLTNSLGHGISLNLNFDTFSQSNTMVEAEDFDYGGGQFVTNWVPDAYDGFGAVTNIDFQHTTISGEAFLYRTDGIPEGKSSDYLRQAFVDVLGTDYDATWFGNGDWANYTRVYPAGNYYVYGRFSGLGNYTMYLDQVVSGAGTTNQVTKRLGRWNANGAGYSIYNWVPLTDAGLVAPVVVTLSGQVTLRLSTTGNTNPNYFMLVPTSGIVLTASRSGNNAILSFPTQPGLIYRVLTRDQLTAGSWTLLTTVVGNGSTQSISNAPTKAQSYYKVVSP
jgi:hypothetical protein